MATCNAAVNPSAQYISISGSMDGEENHHCTSGENRTQTVPKIDTPNLPPVSFQNSTNMAASSPKILASQFQANPNSTGNKEIPPELRPQQHRVMPGRDAHQKRRLAGSE